MNIKIKLKVRLCEINKTPYIGLTFIDVDDRFIINDYGVEFSYKSSKSNLWIKSKKQILFGEIIENGITIPRPDKMGYELTYGFCDDDSRFIYLKKLYQLLDEWSNYWTRFYGDSNSFICVKDSIWEIKNK